MPPRPAARASASDELDANRRIRMRFLPRQDVEGKRQQAIAGENRGRFVVFLVRRRLPAPQVVIVHGRQVVVHQRIAMHAFQGRTGHQSLPARDREQCRTFHHHKGPEALAAAETGIAHGLDQARRAADLAGRRRRRQEPIQQILGVFCGRVEPRQEGAVLAFIPGVARPSGLPVRCCSRPSICGITMHRPAARTRLAAAAVSAAARRTVGQSVANDL